MAGPQVKAHQSRVCNAFAAVRNITVRNISGAGICCVVVCPDTSYRDAFLLVDDSDGCS